MPVTLKDYGLDNEDFENINNKESSIAAVKQLLNATGCGFCLAKFKQVTLHLGTGMAHSCHHPTPHKIPLSEIEHNPMALFNSSVLKTARTQMLNNEKPAECDYCWRVEENNGNSDRFYKSLEVWALPQHDSVTLLKGDEDLYPSYLEVSFGNACNLSCLYCGPEFSSKWVEELKSHGPMIAFGELEASKKTLQGWQDLDNLNYKHREFNPYIDAFWKTFPEVYKHLKNYRITGGEPLMSKETFRSMDWFIENPNLNLDFSINTNLSVPDKIWKNFMERLRKIRHGCVKKVTIYTSIEGWGDRASYARSGLDFEVFKSRVEEIAELGNVRCIIMSTFNIFSVTSFKDLLAWILDLKKRYNTNNAAQRFETETGYQLKEYSYTDRKKNNPAHTFVIGIDIPYLRHPNFLDMQYCTHELVEQYLLPCIEFMSENTANPSWSHHQGFEPYELEKMKRIVLHRLYYNKKLDLDRDSDEKIRENRAAFYDFVNEIDRRRGTSFLDTFPEMADYYAVCATARAEHVKDTLIKEKGVISSSDIMNKLFGKMC